MSLFLKTAEFKISNGVISVQFVLDK
jgi:hypothetical protein